MCALTAWLALLLGTAPAQAQTSGTPQSATLLGTALTLTFDKGGAGIVRVDRPPLVHGFTVDGLGSGSVHPSAVDMDNRTVTLELPMAAEPGQTVTVSYDPDMVPNTAPSPGLPEGMHNPLRYTDGTLVPAFSVPVTAPAPKPATGLSVSFVSGRTVKVSWTLPAQPAGVSVTAVELWSDMNDPGVTEVPRLSLYGRLAADATSRDRRVFHGGHTYYHRVRLVTNAGDADTEVVSWTSNQEYLQPATGLTASNATTTTVDLAWTLPEQPAWVAQMPAGEVWSEVQQQEADGTWSRVAKLAANAAAHTVTGLIAGTAYSFRVALMDSFVISPSEPVSVTTLAATALTASFHDVPSEHDGESEFNFELRFSEDLVRELSSATLREKALQATNATVTRAKRVVKRENRLWTITVRPHSADKAVTVSLPATTDCSAAGALCTPDGRRLSNATTATVAAQQWARTPLESARLLGTELTLTFGKPVVIVNTDLLRQGFTVDGISNSGSVLPSAMAMDNRTATLELGMGAESGQTVTVSYDPDKVARHDPRPGYPEGWHNPLRYTDGTLVAAFSGVVVTVGPEPATGLSFSFEGGITGKVSWTLPAQPAGVSVTAVELWSDRTDPGVTVPDLRRSRRSGDTWTWQPWGVVHGGFTYHFRVRLVTNFGDVDSQVLSWTSGLEGLNPATGLTASNATQTTVDLAWTLPTEQPEWATQVAGDFWTAVEQQVADGGWSEVARPADDAVAHTVTGLSAGTAYSFRIRLGVNIGPAYSEPVSVTTLAATGLTASFQEVPAGHDGETEFSFELRFSENFPGRLRYKVLRDEALQATNGRVTGARRVTQGQNQRWTITVRPAVERRRDRDAAGDGGLLGCGRVMHGGGQEALEHDLGDDRLRVRRFRRGQLGAGGERVGREGGRR